MDCLEFLSKVENNSVDLILTDPPYGVNFKNDFYNDEKSFVREESKKWLTSLYNVLKEGCHCYIFTGTKSLVFWLNNIESSSFQFNNIVNLQSYCNGQYLKNNFYYRTEHLIFLSKGKAKNLNKIDFIKTSDSWLNDKRNKNKKAFTHSYPNFITSLFANEKANVKKLLHPNQKNLKTLETFIELSSNKNDIVLDCFAGSGSTALACQNTKRNFLCCENNKEYVDLANKRLNEKLF